MSERESGTAAAEKRSEADGVVMVGSGFRADQIRRKEYVNTRPGVRIAASFLRIRARSDKPRGAESIK